MSDVSVLEVLLYDEPIGTLTRLTGDRTIFVFNEDYIRKKDRATLGLYFKDSHGELVTDFRPYQTRVMPYFSNMLPEGQLREYLANRAGIRSQREFFLLWVLGQDLSGAVTVRPYDGDSLPPDADELPEADHREDADDLMRFSLAGIQLKFSAVMEKSGGLTIPARGVGGSWIVKLPSPKFQNVPENEYSMMDLARKLGMNVPEIKLLSIDEVNDLPEGMDRLGNSVFAIRRFDRDGQDGRRIHTEDFAQVFGLFPEKKYERASYLNIAEVLGIETSDEDVAEFIRRLVFNTLIGNADMHAKNWSLIYHDRKRPSLSPAYDFVATVAYLPDEKSALKYSRTKRMDEFTLDELSHLAARARLPETMVLDVAKETVNRFRELWPVESKNLPIDKAAIDVINAHIAKLPIADI